MPPNPNKPKETEFEKRLEEDSPLKKLMKIFRSNTVTSRHMQGAPNARAKGVAQVFFKQAYSFQSSVVPGYSAYDRFARLSTYAEMEAYPIIGKAFNLIAEEATQRDESGKIVTISSPDTKIQSILEKLVDRTLQLNGNSSFKIVRDLGKYGDDFRLIDITPDEGVVNLIKMPASEVEREEGYDKDEPTAVRFRWTAKQNIEIPNAFVAHFRLDGNDQFWPYGTSIAEAATRPWRQLVLLEDIVMVYRMTRSAERRAFFFDVGGLPPSEVEPAVLQFNESVKKKKVVNEQGKVDLRYGATLDMTEDYVIPVRGSDSGTRIETLPGGQNIGDIEDIEMIRSNLFAALGIPKAFLTFDDAVGSKQVMTHEDIRFARTIQKIQESVINEIVKICFIHLYILGFRGSDLFNFKVKMTNPSTVAELQKSELWRARMDLVQAAGQGVFDTTFIYKNFLHLSDDAIDMVRKGQIQDKIFQAKLLAIENNGVQMPGAGGMGGMGGGMGGMGGGMPPMDMGGGGMPDLGGAPPNAGGMPSVPMEGFNPSATVFDAKNSNPGHDLSRSKDGNKRLKNDRGLPEDELISTEDVANSASDAVAADEMRRDITSPFGMDESMKWAISGYNLLKEGYEHLEKQKKSSDSGYFVMAASSANIDRDVMLHLERIESKMGFKKVERSSAVLAESERDATETDKMLDKWLDNITSKQKNLNETDKG